MKIEIRYGEPGPALGIRRSVFMEEQGVSYEEEMDGRDESSYHLVVYVKEKPVACARFYEDAPGSGIYIAGRVAVLKPYRGRGIGALVMRTIVRRAQEAQVREIRIAAQDSVIPFYRSLGYELTADEGFPDAGIPHHRMIRRID